MYTLYHFQISCSSAVKIALEVIGAEHDTVTVNLFEGEQHKPEFLAVNPLGKVPVLVEGDQVMTQGEAILIYLSQKHKDANLMPDLSTKEGMNALKWLNLVASSLHGHFTKIFHPESVATDQLSVKQNAEEEIIKLLNTIEAQLNESAMFVGEQPTLADFYFAVVLGWGQVLSFDLFERYPSFAQYKKELQQHLPQSKTLQMI
ncbi:glutathione S-transferase family protein [Thalassotalea marina]|uniref:Glutathione S-transferase n=1 Tax=Thalassotalea marina TaxID=1673741 RepID=A0A919BIZ9_9GAMM|nr:glutathione S-transferase family protein [Thalassotalea marina]GHF94208.1 glutathione S-transferase [Thalassotalea marina]